MLENDFTMSSETELWLEAYLANSYFRLADVVSAGSGRAPGVGDAGGALGEPGQALVPADGAVLVRAVCGPIK